MNKYKKSRRKASEILIFADQSKQTTGSYTKNWDPKTKKADKYCALGLLGHVTKNIPDRDGVLNNIDYDFLSDVFGIGKITDIECPNCSSNLFGLNSLISHMNDNHKWSFKKIGRMLKKFE